MRDDFDAAARWGDQDPFEDPGVGSPADDEADLGSYRVVDPTALLGVAVPRREWIVEDWLPIGHATACYGDGGVGKTLLAQQLMTSCATGMLWCGRDVTRCRTFGIFCEDSEEELHRRQDKINDSIGLNFGDLSAMRWISGIGLDNLMMTFDHRGRSQLTERFREIERRTKDFGAKLLVIDTAADVFGGDENNRSQVRQFIGHALNSTAIAIGGAVLLNAHPSRSGMSADGDMDGGSTAWSNTVRSRWSLSRPKAKNDTEADADERLLTRRKANYAAVGETIRLRWCDGVLVPATGDDTTLGVGSAERAEHVFLSLLDKLDAAGRRVSDSKHAPNFAPKMFANQPDRQGYGIREFTGAMERLFAGGHIVMATYGRPGDARQRIAHALKPNEIVPAVVQ